MRSSKQHQEAQIGVIVVLLSTILLAIGVSVSSRVIRQTQNEITRQESSQQLHQAESGADMGSQMTDGGGSGASAAIGGTDIYQDNPSALAATTDERNKIFSSDIDTVYLQVGETVRIPKKSLEKSDGFLRWELSGNDGGGTPTKCSEKPSLLLTFTKTDGTTTTVITPVAPADCSDPNMKSYEPATKLNSTKYRNQFTISDKDGDLTIEALYAPTYVYLDKLTTAVRSASANQTGDEARVVEQADSHLAPNYVNNFTLFAGMNMICQGTFNELAGTTDDDGNPGSGTYQCK